MIDGKNVFDKPLKDNKITYENIRKPATGQGDDYVTGSLLDHPQFKENHKMIAIDLIKQQTFDANPTAIQQTTYTVNLHCAGNTKIFFILEEGK